MAPEAPTASLIAQIENIGRALTASELADLLSVSRITIFKHAREGRIPNFRIGTCVRFSPHSVVEYLKQQGVIS